MAAELDPVATTIRAEVGKRETKDLDQKERQLDREHQLKLERTKRRYKLLQAAIVALIGGLATVGAEVAKNIGAKANEGRSTSSVQNIVTGASIVFNMATSKEPLSASIPALTVPATTAAGNPAPTVSPTPAPAAAVQPSVSADTLSTSPEVLNSCFGAGQLKFERVRVDTVRNGYQIMARLKNPADSPVSLWVESDAQLNDTAKNNISGSSNLPRTNYYTFVNMEQKSLENAFVGGKVIQPGDSGPLTLQFLQREELTPGHDVSFHIDLASVSKDSAGKYAVSRSTLSCQNVPVMAGATP